MNAPVQSPDFNRVGMRARVWDLENEIAQLKRQAVDDRMARSEMAAHIHRIEQALTDALEIAERLLKATLQEKEPA